MNTTNILRTAERKKMNLEEEFKNLSAKNYTTPIKDTIDILEEQIKDIVKGSKSLASEIEKTKTNLIEKMTSKTIGQIQEVDKEALAVFISECKTYQTKQQKELNKVAKIYFRTSFFIASILGGGAISLFLVGVFH